MYLKNRKIFITGGTSGIGLELAKQLSEQNNIVIVCGRNQKKINKIKRKYPKIHIIKCDIRRDDDIEYAAKIIEQKFRGIDILVNNAGVQFIDNFNDSTYNIANAEEIINTDFLGLLKITLTFLPILKREKDSAIVNISSAVAYAPIPSVAVYSAIKSAVASLSKSMRFQLKHHNIKVFTVYPPKVNTALNKFKSGGKGISPKRMALAIICGMKFNSYEIRTGLSRLVYIGSRLLPSITEKILQKF